MSVCEDYSYIAKRLREIEDEALHAKSGRPELSTETPTQTTRPSDFNGWFWQLVSSTG